MDERFSGPFGYEQCLSVLGTVRTVQVDLRDYNKLDAAVDWTVEHFGLEMVERVPYKDGYYIYPDRAWYYWITSFDFQNPDHAFEFKMRWG